MVSADEALNRILSRQCGANVLEDGWHLYIIEFCCMESLEVEARSIDVVHDENDNYLYSTFEIRSIKERGQ